MGQPDTLRLLAPVGAALAVLLVAGVAALCRLLWQTTPPVQGWRPRLRRLAQQSPWQRRDLGWLVLLVAAAHIVRPAFPDHFFWDQMAFHGVLAAGCLWRIRGKTRPFGLRLPWRTAATQALLAWLAVLPILWFTAFAWQLLLRAAGHAPDIQQAIRLFMEAPGFWPRAGFIGLAVLVAPAVEEILFRGILLPLLVRRIGALPGLALSSLGFAALHGDVEAFPALAVLSVALSLAYVRSGSLRVPILMHMVFNGVNLLLVLGLIRAGVM